MLIIPAFICLMLCNLEVVHPILWFGSKRIGSKASPSGAKTREKLKTVLSLYNLSAENNLSIDSSHVAHVDNWSAKGEQKVKNPEAVTARSGQLSAVGNPSVRRYSDRTPMDGATFVMSNSVVKSEVLAAEAELAREETEKNRIIAVMAARQELKTQQLSHDQQDQEKEQQQQEQQQLEEVGSIDEPPRAEDLPNQEDKVDSSWVSAPTPARPKKKKIDFSQRLRLKSQTSKIKYRKGNVKVLTSAKKKGKSNPSTTFSSQHHALVFSRKTWCQNARKDYGIESYVSFGSATKAAITIWKDYKCNKLLESKLSVLNPLAECSSSHSRTNDDGSGGGPLVTIPTLDIDNKAGSVPVIAVLVRVSTRLIDRPRLRDLDLYTVSIPSLMSSLDCGFRYTVLLGYDVGDGYYDSEVGMEEVAKWFRDDVAGPLMKNGIYISLTTVAVSNTAHTPGVVYNVLAQKAVAAGAEFLYRINDDTEFLDSWPQLFIEALRTLSPPLVGVVGPGVSGSQSTTLSQDFVHRTHMDIFGPHYYPLTLSAVHMDKWMSRVYGRNRTFVASGVGIAHRSDQPAQKANSFIPDEMVTDLIVRGKRNVLDWLRRNVSNDLPVALVAELESPFVSLTRKIRLYPVDTEAEAEVLWQEEAEDSTLTKHSVKSLSDRQKWCTRTKRIYNVKPYLDWGSNISDAQKVTWKEYACNMFFIAKKLNKRGVSRCGGDNLNRSLAAELPLIAVMAATTTRKIRDPSVSNIALFTILLPSLVRSLDCGFRYMYVLGYDAGDSFFDSKKGLVKTLTYFNTNVQDRMRDHGILVTLQLVKVHNTLRKPGPVFIEMAKAGYASGADFFYRVNDDTELLRPWAKAYARALSRLSKPYGVVGPYSVHSTKAIAISQNRILTHDFVHRTHMEIFDLNYYPPVLSDWWMDDWVSSVYGRNRTFISEDCAVMHHTTTHGKRYAVDFNNEKYLGPLVEAGRRKILEWMVQNRAELPNNAVREFAKTHKDYSPYPFSDINDVK